MIKPNDSISIDKVSNGFVIKTEVRQHEMASLNDTSVCNTLPQLKRFLDNHFNNKTTFKTSP